MLLQRLKYLIAHLFPGYFALVMATGIVSIAAHLLDIPQLATPLFYLNVVFYILLWVLLLCRVFFYFPHFKRDISNHARGGGFLTIVAATHILGSQFLTMAHMPGIAKGLFYFGFILWVVLMYLFFTMITVKKGKPGIEKGINGIWLLLVVATQSVSVLATQLVEFLPFLPEITLFWSLVIFLVGCCLYLIIITLIFYRLVFFELKAEEFAPPYWINMGAVAIITLAGSTLLIHATEWPFLIKISDFLYGFTLLFWATGTWWIPIMLIMGVWRHVYRAIPLIYHPQYWGMVFPLGMYTACTFQLAYVMNLPFLDTIPSVFIYAAVAAWLLAILGMSYKTMIFLFRK